MLEWLSLQVVLDRISDKCRVSYLLALNVPVQLSLEIIGNVEEHSLKVNHVILGSCK